MTIFDVVMGLEDTMWRLRILDESTYYEDLWFSKLVDYWREHQGEI